MSMELIIPYVQPIVDKKNHNVLGYEILTRFSGRYSDLPLNKKMLNSLISTNEKELHLITTLMKKIYNFIIREKINFPKRFFLTFNISPKTLCYEKLVSAIDFFINRFNSFGIEIILEVTELGGLKDFSTALKNSKKLTEIGVKLSMDDFGTGYSNFDRMISLDFNFIKIDKFFIKSYYLNPKFFSLMMKSIIEIANFNGCKTIIEGIETIEDEIIIHDLPIDYCQGFLYGRPACFFDLAKSC